MSQKDLQQAKIEALSCKSKTSESKFLITLNQVRKEIEKLAFVGDVILEEMQKNRISMRKCNLYRKAIKILSLEKAIALMKELGSSEEEIRAKQQKLLIFYIEDEVNDL